MTRRPFRYRHGAEPFGVQPVLFPVGEGPFPGGEDLDVQGGAGEALEDLGGGAAGGGEDRREDGPDVLGVNAVNLENTRHGSKA